MHPPPRLFVLAAACGAAIGAIAAWQIAASRWFFGPDQRVPARGSIAANTVAASFSSEVRATEPTAATQSTAIATVHTTEQLAQAASQDAGSADASASASTANASSTMAAPSSDTAAARVYREIEWGTSTDRQADEQSCTAGDADGCLRLAEAEAVHRTSAVELEKSRVHRERAYSILVYQCNRRSPDACVRIARMHALGVGVARDPASERALLDRATNLCKKLPGKVCEILGS